MLPKDNRLQKGYYPVLKYGKKLKTKFFIVFYKENGLPSSRFGIITTKKLGNAVVRNRTKRMIKSIIRQHLAKIHQGKDIVIIPSYFVGSWKEVVYEAAESDLFNVLTTI